MTKRIAVILFFTLLALTAPAAAQAPNGDVPLTAAQIEGFIAAHKDVQQQVEKLLSENSNSAIKAALEATSRRYGFKDFNEYDAVAITITIIMAGIDPLTRVFTEPPVMIEKEIAEVKAARTLPDKEKAQALAELNEALKNARPLRYPENVPLVLKYFERIESAMQ